MESAEEHFGLYRGEMHYAVSKNYVKPSATWKTKSGQVRSLFSELDLQHYFLEKKYRKSEMDSKAVK
jgi:hypothetical protein